MTESPPTLLRQVNLLEAPGQPPRRADVRIEEGRLVAIRSDTHTDIHTDADRAATGIGSAPGGSGQGQAFDASRCWLAPPLVDPHSVLEDPLQGRSETLSSLAEAAAAGGYGTVALLPWGTPWRDHPADLNLRWGEPLQLHHWGSFSRAGGDQDLAGHDDQIRAGAIGLAGGAALPAAALLERGLRLGEMGSRPVLLAPRDPSLSQLGFVRERVQALRAGWPVDPPLSELLPLETLLALATALPQVELRLMNLSTLEAVRRLQSMQRAPQASVCWWHLLADSGTLAPGDGGWRVEPSLGGPADREALIEALASGLIGAVSVHHLALDQEEMLLSLEQRQAGVAGHGADLQSGFGGVLPSLWKELVVRRRWPVDLLWERLCWGPARFLGLEPERLSEGSRRWILFDPAASTACSEAPLSGSLAANHVTPPGGAQGAIVASGLQGPTGWWAPGGPSC